MSASWCSYRCGVVVIYCGSVAFVVVSLVCCLWSPSCGALGVAVI